MAVEADTGDGVDADGVRREEGIAQVIRAVESHRIPFVNRFVRKHA